MKRYALLFPVALAASVILSACGGSSSGSAKESTAAQSAASKPGVAETNGGQYVQRNLVSDGAIPAEHTDPNLVNAWGITFRGASPWWVSDNGTGVTTLYNGEGVAQFPPPVSPSPLVVNVIGAGGAPAAPTGNASNTGSGFVVSAGGASGPAFFLFASEDGTISGWNPNVPPPVPPATLSTVTEVVVDNSSPNPLGGAVYKGLTIASTAGGALLLYATDFRGAKVDVFNDTFGTVTTSGGFADPDIPAGFAPFGIRAIGGSIFVTYALQDDAKHDDVAGNHNGFVNEFTTDGVLIRRVASRGKLNSPWGLAMAPENGFGRFSGNLLVGNFGDGHIIGFNSDGTGNGAFLTGKGGRITIDGLWGLSFGNDAAAGPSTTLFFAAGPNHEADGLFGRIDFSPPPGQVGR
jgi:uncharacterized protein (TIGR03118 family)